MCPRHRYRYGQLITQVCRSADQVADQVTARQAWQVLAGWVAWAPELPALITDQLTDLDDRVLWRLAVPPLLALLRTGQPGSVFREVTGKLADLDGVRADADEPGRDRPARQRLTFLVHQVEKWARGPDLDPDLDRTPLAEAGRHLARKPDFTWQAASLLVAATSIHHGKGRQLAGQLTEICDLLQDQDTAATLTAQAIAFHVANDTRADPDTLYAAAKALENDHRLCVGLITVALSRHGAKLGWPATWQALIRLLRAHPLADVRAAALDVVMAPE